MSLGIKKINTVSKAEDLFPLLVFNSADVIALSEDNYLKLKEVFTAKTSVVNIVTHPIYFPRVYQKKGTTSELIKKLETMSKENLNLLGFDAIERVQK